MAECRSCLTSFDEQKNTPRICNNCGNSLCQRCLSSIYSSEHTYKCPFCKTNIKTIWTKNQSLISLISSNSNNKCEPHNRKAISLCCSSNCIVSPAICDLAQCSKLHKEKGLNNLPLSFFHETPSDQKDSMADLIVEKLMSQTRSVIESILNQQKTKFLSKCLQKPPVPSWRKETQQAINLIRQNKFCGISSKNLAQIKKEMIFVEQDQEAQMMSHFIQLVDDQKKVLINTIICAIDKIEVNLFETIVMGKSNTTPNQKKTPTEISLTKRKSTKETPLQIIPKIETQTTLPGRTQKQLYQDAIKLCFEPKSHLEYELIRQIIGRDFSIKLLFSAAKDPAAIFKQKVSSEPNLFVRIELADGKILGSFFKQNYPSNFGSDEFVTDPDAFVYWLNQFRVYKAAKASIAQYDISPDYLFSCGSTYNWDGFWFRKDFNEINPEMPATTKEIKSKQYVDLSIPLPDRKVIRFEAYQLQFK